MRFGHIITPSSLQLDSDPEIYICFHQLLAEGSMTTIKVAVNLITGEEQFRHPLHDCLDS